MHCCLSIGSSRDIHSQSEQSWIEERSPLLVRIDDLKNDIDQMRRTEIENAQRLAAEV